jgi:hypothetical protein
MRQKSHNPLIPLEILANGGGKTEKLFTRQCRPALGLPGFPACLGNRPDQLPQ